MQKNTLFVIAAVVALGLTLMFASQYLAGQGIGSGTIAALSDADHIKGNKDAAVTLIEYGDYQCPACAGAHPLIEQVLSEMGQSVVFSFRHFPLSQHANAPLAAYAAEAAGLQGKYWEMHAKLYENQTLWATQTNARDHFIAFAKDLGLNVQKFQNDLDSQEVKNKVQKDKDDARNGAVDETPSFFINGKRVRGLQSVADFKKALEAAATPAQ